MLDAHFKTKRVGSLRTLATQLGKDFMHITPSGCEERLEVSDQDGAEGAVAGLCISFAVASQHSFSNPGLSFLLRLTHK